MLKIVDSYVSWIPEKIFTHPSIEQSTELYFVLNEKIFSKNDCETYLNVTINKMDQMYEEVQYTSLLRKRIQKETNDKLDVLYKYILNEYNSGAIKRYNSMGILLEYNREGKIPLKNAFGVITKQTLFVNQQLNYANMSLRDDMTNLFADGEGIIDAGVQQYQGEFSYDGAGKHIRKYTTFSVGEEIPESKADKLAIEAFQEFACKARGNKSFGENMKFNQFCEIYFEEYAPNKLKRVTAEHYRSNVKNHIAPVFGNAKLKDITTSDITAFLTGLRCKPLTASKIKIVFHSILLYIT